MARLLVTIVLLLYASHPIVGQESCESPMSGSGLPRVCTQFYGGGDGFYNESFRNGLRMTIDDLAMEFVNIFDDTEPCVNLVLNFLCYYYYPVCNLTTGVVSYTCVSSCGLLINDAICSSLLSQASNRIEQVAPEPEADCEITSQTVVTPLVVANECISIEDTLSDPLPLNCQPITHSRFGDLLFSNTHFATTGSELIIERGEVIMEFDQLGEDVTDGCIQTLLSLDSLLSHPACNLDTGMVTPLCPEMCPVLELRISDNCGDASFVNNTVNFPFMNNLININCSDPESYFNFPSIYFSNAADDCVSFVIASNNGDAISTGAIVGIVVGAVLVIIIIIIIIIILAIFVIKAKRRRDHIPVMYKESDHSSTDQGPRYMPPLTRNDPSSSNDSAGDNKQEINQFLQYVKEKFSEVLLPADIVTKSDFLGKGVFGVVHKGELVTADGVVKAVAIKTIKSTSLDGMKDLVAETAIMKAFHHPNVLPLLGVCVDYDDDDVLKIVIPFMAHGDLRTFLKKSRVSPNNTQEYPKDLSEVLLKRMCLDVAKGLEYLAERRFVHRDLAARNCMVDESLRIRVADFGLTRDVYSTEYYRIEKHTTLPVKWMALESLLDGYFDEKTDVWSYGVTCWEIFSLGRIPYPGVDNAEVIKTLKNGERLDKPDLCPTNMYEMLESTWNTEPDKRPSFSDVVRTLSDGVEDTGVTSDDNTVERTNSEPNGYIDIHAQ